jgi:hypothetical protein
MLFHAAANLMPLAASNRVGVEEDEDSRITFYGSSFIAGPTGQKIAEAGRSEETCLVAEFDWTVSSPAAGVGISGTAAGSVWVADNLRRRPKYEQLSRF